MSKKALVIEGGAMRSIFSSGLFDGFINQQFNPFDFSLGVSAGAFNLLAYQAQLIGTGREIFRQLSSDSQFINFSRFIRHGHLVDLNYADSFIFDRQEINYKTAFESEKKIFVTITNALTGTAEYIEASRENIRALLRASAALPLLYRDFPVINNIPMTDGGVADGIPLRQAIKMGAENIMVVRARHSHYTKKDTLAHKFIRWKLKQHTALVNTMKDRVNIYNDTLSVIRQPPEHVNIVEVCPPANFSAGRLSRSSQLLDFGYQAGFDHADIAIRQWNELPS